MELGLCNEERWIEDEVHTCDDSGITVTTQKALRRVVQSHQRAGAGSVDSLGWTLEIENIGDAVGDDAVGRAGRCILWDRLEIAELQCRPVISHGANVDRGQGALELIEGQSSRFDCFVDGFQEEALLRVHASS